MQVWFPLLVSLNHAGTAMWEYTLVTTADVPPDDLWAVISEGSNRPEWNPDVAAVSVKEPLRPGVGYELRTRGGRTVRLTVEDCSPPYRFAETVRLPFARVRTAYQFTPDGTGSVVRVTLRVSGPLGFLWRRVFKWESDLAGRAHRFISYTRRLVTA